MHGVALGAEALQAVEVVARQADFFNTCSLVDHGQADQDTLVHPFVDPGFAGFPERCQSLVLEALDHGESVN